MRDGTADETIARFRAGGIREARRRRRVRVRMGCGAGGEAVRAKHLGRRVKRDAGPGQRLAERGVVGRQQTPWLRLDREMQVAHRPPHRRGLVGRRG